MKIIQSLSKFIFYLILSLVVCIILYTIFYKAELYLIKFKLSNIDNVEVKNVWGHEDVTMEEVSARVYVKGKGDVVLANLSSDVKDFPKKVIINEIGGYSFIGFHDYGQVFSSYLNVGKNSDFWNKTKIEFNKEEDIIKNYDSILRYVQSLDFSPKINKIDDGSEKYYLLVKNQKKPDVNSIYELYEVDDYVKLSEKLDWNFEK